MCKTVLFAAVLAVVLAAPAGARVDSYVPTFPASTYPAWSPNGRQIAFTTNRLGTDDIYLMNADGGNQRPLIVGGADEWWPAWSSDSSRIAFVSDRDGLPQIYTFELATREVTRLTFSQADNDDDGDYTPEWSSDGRIVFCRTLHDRNEIFVMNADGTDLHRLVEDEGWDFGPAWSPDATRIAFVGGPEDAAFIDVMSADGTGRTRLTTSGADYQPSWSPDGRQIVFTSWRDDDEQSDLWIMNADGSGQRKLLGGDASEKGPSFSPKGARIAFVSDSTGENQVYVASADGSHAARLTGLARVMSSTGRRCTVIGTPGADVLHGTPRDDVICGLGGNDLLDGRGGADLLDGGAGNDVLTGGPGDDTMLGGPGRDTLYAADGFRDSVDGGPGADRGHIDPGDWVSFVEVLF